MIVLLGLLPAIALLVCVGMAMRRHSGRDAFVRGSVLAGVALVVVTETLSAAGALARVPLMVAWATLIAAGGIAIWSNRRTLATSPIMLPKSTGSIVTVSAMAIIALVLCATAVLAPPNTWDVLTCHLSRVSHWLQNGNVTHFPTHFTQELYQPPFTEFAMAHLVALSGTDRLTNLVSWGAWVAGAATVSLLARELGATSRGQLVAAVFWITLPMGILQATSSKSDTSVSLWLTIFVYFALRASRNDDASARVQDCAYAGAALGLALLSKGTAYIFAAPFGMYLVVALLRRRSYRSMGVFAAIVLALNMGYYVRNLRLWGQPLGPPSTETTEHFANAAMSPSIFVSNVTRNLTLHLGMPFDAVNNRTEAVVRRFHDALDLSPEDPRSTWSGATFTVQRMSRAEEIAGNPLHVLVGLLALLLGAAILVRRGWTPTPVYGGAVLLAFALFCVYLRWQPWHSRLHTPLFALAAPFVGLTLTSRPSSRKATLVMAILLIAALPWTLDNWSRRLVPLEKWAIPRPGQSQLLGMDRLELYPYIAEYRRVALEISQLPCHNVGILTETGIPEYELWMLLRRGNQSTRIEHVGVRNRSADLMRQFEPCAIMCVNCADAPEIREGRFSLAKRWRYRLGGSWHTIAVFKATTRAN